MNFENSIVINDFTEVDKLCRVCLKEDESMTSLHNKFENNEDYQFLLIFDALCKVFGSKISSNSNYPSYICSICLGMLDVTYKFVQRFQISDIILKKYFQSHEEENENFTLTSGKSPQNNATVELIAGSNKYDVKDIVVVEYENEPVKYDGFLKNLGTEVSVSFARKDKTPSDSKKVIMTNSMSIIKHNKEVTDEVIANDQPRDDCVKKTVSTDESFPCRYCGKIFLYRKYLTRHVRLIHLKRDVNQTFLCQICGWLAKTKSGLYHHTESKHKERKFECKQCGKKYISVGHLRQHEMVHENDRTHLCSICGKGFNYANALIYHMRTHTGEKKYKCPYCDRSFAMQCAQKRHIRTHTGVRPYKCNFCERAFRSKGEANIHEMIHTGYRPYHCKYCGKGFTKTHNLKTHLLGHRGPHVCDICDRSFIEVDYLKLHLKISHGKKEQAFEEMCAELQAD